VPPRTPRSAGDAVLARAARFSDELLAREQDCFAAIAVSFARSAEAAAPLVRAAFRRGGTVQVVARDRLLSTQLSAGTGRAVAGVRPYVAALAADAQAMALLAVTDELLLCEDALSVRYGGTAAAALAGAERRLTAVPTDVVATLVAGEQRVVDATDAAVAAQLQAAAVRDADVAEVIARLCSLVPLNLPGNGGVGVLLRPVSGLQADARAVSIRVANTARETAMEQFNTIAEWVKGRRARLI
jgi:hypothetical protein